MKENKNESIAIAKNAKQMHGDKWWNDLESEEKRESEKYYFTGKLPEKLNTKEKCQHFLKQFTQMK